MQTAVMCDSMVKLKEFRCLIRLFNRLLVSFNIWCLCSTHAFSSNQTVRVLPFAPLILNWYSITDTDGADQQAASSHELVYRRFRSCSSVLQMSPDDWFVNVAKLIPKIHANIFTDLNKLFRGLHPGYDLFFGECNSCVSKQCSFSAKYESL